MSNILNNISSNADERTELIEYKRVYFVVKYLAPIFFIFTYYLITKQLFINLHLDPNVKFDYLSERFTMYSMLFSFLGYCLTLYLFKVSNLLRFLFYSIVMYFISFAVGIYVAMLSTNIYMNSNDLSMITYLIVFIPLLIGVGFNLFTQMRGTYAFWSKSDLKHFLAKFSNFLISRDLIENNTNSKKINRIFIILYTVLSILFIVLAVCIILFDPNNTLRIGLDDLIISPLITGILSINAVSFILFLINKTERLSLILSGIFIFNHFFIKFLRYALELVYGTSSNVNIPLELLSIVLPVLALIISIRLLRRK